MLGENYADQGLVFTTTTGATVNPPTCANVGSPGS